MLNVGLGFANVVGGAGAITGAAATSTVHFGMLSGPAGAIGGYRIGLGFAALSRGTQQIGEAFSESVSQESPRNFLGLLPSGQVYDDVSEPTPVEYAKVTANSLKEDWVGTVVGLIRDFFAWRRDER